jgi:hypothetical protein
LRTLHLQDAENVLGINKLISTNAAHVFSSSNSSIFILGLIAFSKTLSPSHAQESISLYMLYKRWLKSVSQSEDPLATDCARLLKCGFLGFQSNRFGRTTNLATTFKDHCEVLHKFFDDVVDESSNKLTLACVAYLRSPWFNVCCEIAAYFDSLFVIPFKTLLGIDVKTPKNACTWWDVKGFLTLKLKELDEMSEVHDAMTPKEKLTAKAAANISEALSRQMQYMPFFSESSSFTIEKAPVTNSGAESHFADADNRLKKTGGSSSLATISNRHMITKNKLFKTEKWQNLSENEKTIKWM